jgi:hypothetical protein
MESANYGSCLASIYICFKGIIHTHLEKSSMPNTPIPRKKSIVFFMVPEKGECKEVVILAHIRKANPSRSLS